jgi:hypothetical protein
MKTSTAKKVTFKIESDWTPSKSSIISDDFIEAIWRTTKKLEQGQSFAVQVSDMIKRYGFKNAKTIPNALRYILQKNLTNTFMAKISVHEVKEGKAITSIRIRHK